MRDSLWSAQAWTGLHVTLMKRRGRYETGRVFLHSFEESSGASASLILTVTNGVLCCTMWTTPVKAHPL